MTAPTNPPGSGTGAITPEKRALADALDLIRRQDRERRDAAAPKPRRAVSLRMLALLALALGGGYVLAVRPRWLFRRPPAETAPIRDASLRMTLYTTAKRVEAYRAAHGRLPDSLRQVALPVRGVTYSHDGAAWRLEATAGELRLAVASTDSLEAFVGQSYKVLSARENP